MVFSPEQDAAYHRYLARAMTMRMRDPLDVLIYRGQPTDAHPTLPGDGRGTHDRLESQ